jgi:hypothetical protein
MAHEPTACEYAGGDDGVRDQSLVNLTMNIEKLTTNIGKILSLSCYSRRGRSSAIEVKVTERASDREDS